MRTPAGAGLTRASGPRAAQQPRGKTAAAGRRLAWWRELALVAVLYLGYNAVQASVTGERARALHDGRLILRAERAVHLAPELFLNHAVNHIPVLAVPACWVYASLHFIVTPAVLVWTCVRRPGAYRSARAVLAVMTVVALLGFWLFPTAPPRLLPGGGFHDTMEVFRGWGWWGADTSVPTAAHGLANPYAALPSLHVAWATWSGATVFRLSRRPLLRGLACAYPAIVVLVVMATGNHYLTDVVAGFLLWLVVDRAVLAAGHAAARRKR